MNLYVQRRKLRSSPIIDKIGHAPCKYFINESIIRSSSWLICICKVGLEDKRWPIAELCSLILKYLPHFLPLCWSLAWRPQNRWTDTFPQFFFSPDLLPQPAPSKRATRWRCFIEECGRQLFAWKPLRTHWNLNSPPHPTWTNEGRNWSDSDVIWQAERA